MPERNNSNGVADDALAALIASTRRINRKLNLLDIAEKLRIARLALGSLKQVAAAIGLSHEMVRQFSRIETLSPAVKRLLAAGKIRSVDIADRISRLPGNDQLPVAEAVVRGELLSKDVRAVVSLRREVPKSSIGAIMKRVRGSKNVREFVVEFLVPNQKGNLSALRHRFFAILGKKNIKSFRINKGVGTMVLKECGKRLFQEKAKRAGLTKRAFVNSVVAGEAG